MRRLPPILAAGLLLAGCANMSLPGWPKPAPETAVGASAWAKPGMNPADVASAYNDCLDVANVATDNDFAIDQDIAASRGSDLQHSDFAAIQSRDAGQTSRNRAQSVLSSCMEGKGFTPAK